MYPTHHALHDVFTQVLDFHLLENSRFRLCMPFISCVKCLKLGCSMAQIGLSILGAQLSREQRTSCPSDDTFTGGYGTSHVGSVGKGLLL